MVTNKNCTEIHGQQNVKPSARCSVGCTYVKERPRTRKRGDAVAPDRRLGQMSIEIKGTGNVLCLEIFALYVADLEP